MKDKWFFIGLAIGFALLLFGDGSFLNALGLGNGSNYGAGPGSFAGAPGGAGGIGGTRGGSCCGTCSKVIPPVGTAPISGYSGGTAAPGGSQVSLRRYGTSISGAGVVY